MHEELLFERFWHQYIALFMPDNETFYVIALSIVLLKLNNRFRIQVFMHKESKFILCLFHILEILCC